METGKPRTPPKWIDWILKKYCGDKHLEVILGDLHELYYEKLGKEGSFRAKLYYYYQGLGCLRSFAKKNKRKTIKMNYKDMFKSFFKASIRSMKQQKLYTIINTLGLAVGISSFILILLFIKDELSFDKFHDKSNRIYRLVEVFESEGVGERSASQPFPAGPTLKNDFPSMVESTVRLFNFQSPQLAVANIDKDISFNESGVFYVDSTFFDVFDFKVIKGNKKTALDNTSSVMITESMAKKYFDNEDPMGKFLRFQGREDYLVTGILEDPPANSHFQFDFLISFSSLKAFYNGQLPETWYWNPCWTYLVLNENRKPSDLEEQLPEFVQSHFPEFIRDDVSLYLQPLTDIHLKSKLDYEIQANSNEANIYVFGAIGIFILVIACINFVNLATASSGTRAREIAMRKVLGGKRSQLIAQFLTESLAVTLLAIIVSIGITYLALPYFNHLTEKYIQFDLSDPVILLSLTGLFLLIGIGSGIYPAFFLSGFKPVVIFKSNLMRADKYKLRRILVVFQFSISIILIIGTGVATRQLKFLQSDDMGFDKEAIIMLPGIRTPIGEHFETFKEEASTHNSIKSITAVEEIVGSKHQVGNVRFEGMKASRPFPRLNVRHDFTETFGIEVLAGRDYNIETEQEIVYMGDALVVNQKLVEHMGWTPEEAVGKKFNGPDGGEIIGVVKDFNFVSKHNPISPLMLVLDTRPDAFRLMLKYVAVRIDAEQKQEAIDVLINTWNKVLPESPFEYFFLDDNLRNVYKAEARLNSITTVISVLAIFVACLGLFGLATFSVNQRKKEISIRKVMGSTVSQIMILLSKDFSTLIVIAFIIASPIAWIATESWLEGFAYRVDIDWKNYAMSGLISFLIAFISISYHTLRAAKSNPVDSLRDE